jgi:putative spermidine/putrescine transport system ATP-binding protein
MVVALSQKTSGAGEAERQLPPPNVNPPFVQFEGIDKTYDGKTIVVENLNLCIAKGEFLTLLGPSGSGKTTTLMMLAGFEAPTSGRIFLADRPIQGVPPHRRNIGMVFQNYALFPHMTVAENLAYPLKVRHQSREQISSRVSRVLDMVEMRYFAKRSPALLSGGQQQRVALARALVFEPELILMDEPLGALDKRLREQMQLEIKRIHHKLGVTIVYVTHDQSEALTMSDRIAIFNQGRIEQLDPPAALYETPRTQFVANFIGDNNAIGGTVVDENQTACRVRIEGGQIVTSRKITALCKNDRVVVSIRPERLRLETTAHGDENRLAVTVRELIYLGDHIQVHLETDARQSLRAKLVNLPGRLSIEPGQTYHVTWASNDGIALKH